MQLASMVGRDDGVTDQIMNFSTAKTGSFFFYPSLDLLGIK